MATSWQRLTRSEDGHQLAKVASKISSKLGTFVTCGVHHDWPGLDASSNVYVSRTGQVNLTDRKSVV